jgi:(E)-4-hydroxy-3-methylbut-2-enyl-diphosphate synthase
MGLRRIFPRSVTESVSVGNVQIGGGAPIVVQSMTDTDTADAAATADQCLALARAGAELVRVTVDRDDSAAAVAEIRDRLDDAGCDIPLVGDFHYNGHLLLRRNPPCAKALAKYRINPGNVGRGSRAGANFSEICQIALDHGAALRIGVNGGSLDSSALTEAMNANAASDTPLTSEGVIERCMVQLALRSVDEALECGLGADRIVISSKVSRPLSLLAIYRELAGRTSQPLHLGLTEAGSGSRGLVWSTSAMAVLLAEGIGDTIRVSLTPEPDGRRTQEVEVAREMLQALGLRHFNPTIVSCPGCGRTTSTNFLTLARRVGDHIRQRMNCGWREAHPGVENLTVAVMGCVVNGPGESKQADIGISLPGTGEKPRCPVYIETRRVAILQGPIDDIANEFVAMIDEYVATRWNRSTPCNQ